MLQINTDDLKIKYNYEHYHKHGIGVITIASTLIPIKHEVYNHVYCCGLAYQSNKDQFDKKSGREIATHRLYENLGECVFLPVFDSEINSQTLLDFSTCFVIVDIMSKITPYKMEENIPLSISSVYGEFIQNRLAEIHDII